MKMLSVSCW